MEALGTLQVIDFVHSSEQVNAIQAALAAKAASRL